ncbi:unnamed protein product [Anisakis simplex]|uniref:WRKY domain-containing protein n=1 Tax=Anisakis simplex TaxID=6269 RepID=A0A0M3K6F1_ANISI|nr:unnamed protein product [Anisakis simplex]
MDSVDVPTTLLCDQQQETADKSEIKCEIKFEIKCEKFESTAPNTSTETAENGCDMAHDDSSDSGSGIHDETAQNSTAAIDTLVISDEKNMPQLEALLNQVSACQKNNNNDGSFIKTGCNLNDNNESMNGASYDGTLQYSNTLLNDTLMNPVIAQATSAKQKFPNGQSKMKREWRVVGWFTSEATMNEVRKREKVSKRKSVAQINGTKVFYRCNNWRRTNCNFRMYALYHAPDQITLYASGDHDHTTKNPHYVPRSYNGNATCNAVTPSSSSAAQALSSPAQKRKQPRPQQEQQYQSALNNLFMNNKSSLLSLPFSRASSQAQTSLGTVSFPIE